MTKSMGLGLYRGIGLGCLIAAVASFYAGDYLTAAEFVIAAIGAFAVMYGASTFPD